MAEEKKEDKKAEAPVAPPAPPPPPSLMALTKEEKELGERHYQECVKECIEDENATVRSILSLYWKRGRIVTDLLASPRSFGNHTAEQFGLDISQNKKKPYKEEIVRMWQRFYQRYTAPQLETAIKQKIPWRAIQTLSAIEDIKQRDELQGRIAKGEIDSDEIRPEVKEIVKEQRAKATKNGKKPSMSGGCSPITAYKGYVKFAAEFLKKSDEVRESNKAHDKMDPDDPRTKEMAARRKEALKAAQLVAKKTDVVVAETEQ